jgi:hypothetical protein
MKLLCAAFWLGAALSSPLASPLATQLSNAVFYHQGTCSSADEFVYVPMKVSYNEQDNITCTGCRWATGTGWTYLWQRNSSTPSPAPSSPCQSTLVGKDLDVPGNDIGNKITADVPSCEKICCANTQCAAFIFEGVSDVNFGECKVGKPCCFLKSAVPSTKPKKITPSMVLYKINGRPSPSLDVKPPPMGLRSSPALGGLGAGSVELRSDGGFRDWTIFNQGPAGSGKYGIVDDVWMASRINGKAKVLRTQPPGYLSGHAIDALTFSGTYPITRLVLNDSALLKTSDEKPSSATASSDAVQASVFGFSTLKPGDMNASAAPALVLTMQVHNPTAATVDADFMLTLPSGAWTDCSRKGDGKAGKGTITTAGYAECMHACSSEQSW